MLHFDNISDWVDYLTVLNGIHLLLAFQNKPEHDRQKYFSETSEKIERSIHSKVLAKALVED
jgi:hypothetical protein